MLYLRDDDIVTFARTDIGIDVDHLEVRDIPTIAQRLRDAAAKALTPGLCQVAAICALTLRDEYLKGEAIKYGEMLHGSKADGNNYLVTGYIKWAVGRIDDALRDINKAIEIDDAETARDAKNDFVYFVADARSLRRQTEETWLAAAARYVAEFDGEEARLDDATADTVGFYWIVFGETPAEVERGRSLVRTAYASKSSSASHPAHELFYRHHEYVALWRLLGMLGNTSPPGRR